MFKTYKSWPLSDPKKDIQALESSSPNPQLALAPTSQLTAIP